MKNFRKYILDLCGKKEGYTVEFKSAKGGFPGSFWESYSSFANTAGGIIVLGVTEKNNRFKPDGLTEDQITKFKKVFWDSAHNPQKVSVCLLKEEDVIVDKYTEGSLIIIFRISRAPFDAKPVYIDGNPKNTYRRNNEGDYLCTQAEISRMYAEADLLAHPLDSTILKNYSLERDFDQPTINQYRQLFKIRQPRHAWNALDDMGFLRKIEAWREDRETGESGFTLAGVLMFGTEEAIHDAAPNFFVDYREKMSSDPRIRYTDRLYPDGTWVPNLFQFYTRVLEKLYHAIPVKFQLEGDGRLDETPAHESLREAVCNSLIHCQWRMLEGVVIERYPDHLYFSNPGTMLISVEEFFEGGHSICRNRILQKMFIVFGRGERLGSGADIIRQGWKENGWPEPELHEHYGSNTDRVELTLRLKNVSVPITEHSSDSSVISSVINAEAVKDMMRKNSKVTHKQMAEALGITERGAEKITKRMRESGDIVRKGGRHGGWWEVLK